MSGGSYVMTSNDRIPFRVNMEAGIPVDEILADFLQNTIVTFRILVFLQCILCLV